MVALPAIHDRLLEIVRHKTENLRLGSVLLDSNPPDMGSMISSRSFDKLESLIRSAVHEGATLHCGGCRYRHPVYPNGHYFQPTLLSNVTSDMEIAQTELFGPVFLLMKASTVSEALDIANGTSYGLGASVFGYNQTDLKKCIRRLKAGMVSVNDFGSYYACSMPFGGCSGSGYGRFGGEEGLRALSNVKSVCADASWARMLGMRTKIPPPLQYPVDGVRGWSACKGIVETGYAIGLRGKISGLWNLVGALLAAETGSLRRDNVATTEVSGKRNEA